MPSILPSKDYNTNPRKEDVNQCIENVTRDVSHYVNEIKTQPDDFAHQHLEALQASIERAKTALVNDEFKKRSVSISFDDTMKELDSAVSFLTKKGEEEKAKSIDDESHIEKANEIVVALNSIQSLIALFRDVQERTPIKGVDASVDQRYKNSKKKIQEATGEQFNDGKMSK